MEEIIQYLRNKYCPLSIIVYGSFADGTNNENSDFDVLVITESGEEKHDNSTINGIILDAFIYPKCIFEETDSSAFLQIQGGKIVVDTNGIAAKLLESVARYISNIQAKTYEENKRNIDWCEKMLLRAARGDTEGYFRFHWLLTESLEIYCDVIGERYLGPKKSIIRMQAEDGESAELYKNALSQSDYASLKRWIEHLKKKLK